MTALSPSPNWWTSDETPSRSIRRRDVAPVGYVIGPEDAPVLSESGHRAAHVVVETIAELTDSLSRCLGHEGMASFVKGLLFLIGEKESGR